MILPTLCYAIMRGRDVNLSQYLFLLKSRTSFKRNECCHNYTVARNISKFDTVLEERVDYRK